MFYQYNLLKKKGQFGTVWLAAHCPSKLTKHDILSFDVEEKSKEILEFITNGKHNKPRLSIKLSSYLMYGLVVIYQRKISYYFNDLAHINALLKPTLVMATLKAQQKTPTHKSRGNKRVTFNKTAIELKENMPDDFTLDFTFQMPDELNYDITLPTAARIRDITLAETDLEQDQLMHPIQMDEMEFELGPMPTQYLFNNDDMDDDNLARQLMTTSRTTTTITTGPRSTERRAPFAELDLNRLNAVGEYDETYHAIEQAIMAPQPPVDGDEMEINNNQRGLFEMTTTGDNVPRLFDQLVEDTPMPDDKTVKKKQQQQDSTAGGPTVTFLEPETPLAGRLEISRGRLVAKRKNGIVDKTIMIDDREMSRQTKHTPKLPSLPFRLNTKSELLHLKLFEMSNKQAFQDPRMILSKRLHTLDIQNRLLVYTRHPRADIQTLADTSIDDMGMARTILPQLQDDDDLSRRREGRLSILKTQDAASVQRHETEPDKMSKNQTARTSVIPAVNFDLQQQQQPIDFEQVPPQVFDDHSLFPVQQHEQLSIDEERTLTVNDQNILDQIQNHICYFHDLAPILTTKKKQAAAMFSTVLRLCTENKVKATQTGPFEPILLETIRMK